MYTVLICDDEKDIVNALRIYLEAADYMVFGVGNGAEALEIIGSEKIDLILLDIMMPVMDGLTALSAIREKSNVPIILITAKSEDYDKVLGLNVGADDYITKPFNPIEVVARVKSQLRRYYKLGAGSANDEKHFSKGGLFVDDDSKSVTVDGEPVGLTKTEYEILKFMMKNRGKVVSPGEIYQAVWNEPPLGNEKTVAVHIRHIREKTEINPAEPRYIKVIFGRGYIIEKD